MPHKTFPRALFAAVVLVVVTYALPLMVGLGVTQDTEHRWKLGYFAVVAKEASPPPPPPSSSALHVYCLGFALSLVMPIWSNERHQWNSRLPSTCLSR